MNPAPVIKIRTFAYIVAIENYQTIKTGPSITKVRYAHNDARNVKQALIDYLDIDESDITIWLDSEATKSTLENDLKYQVGQLTEYDRLIFYYVGHGFFQDGHNRLTTWDSHPFNLGATSVSIKDILLDPLESSKCEQALIFLDCCANELQSLFTNSRDIIADLSAREFDDFMRGSKYIGVFMSCSPGEKSHSTDGHAAGIWTYHLIQALSGKESLAIVRDKYITSNSLQNYLKLAVPKFITSSTVFTGTQTPMAKIVATSEFTIREIPEEVLIAEPSFPNLTLQFDKMKFRKVTYSLIKKAQGFERRFTVPKWKNHTSEQFVNNIFSEELKGEILEVYEKSKDILGLKPGDFKYGYQNGGSVICPVFKYDIDVEHDGSSLHQAIITRQLTLRIQIQKLPADFDEIFPIRIDELIIPVEGELNFDDILERFGHLQERDHGTLRDNSMDETIEYLSPSGCMIKIDIPNEEVIITHNTPMNCIDLVRKSLVDLQNIAGAQIKLFN